MQQTCLSDVCVVCVCGMDDRIDIGSLGKGRCFKLPASHQESWFPLYEALMPLKTVVCILVCVEVVRLHTLSKERFIRFSSSMQPFREVSDIVQGLPFLLETLFCFISLCVDFIHLRFMLIFSTYFMCTIKPSLP